MTNKNSAQIACKFSVQNPFHVNIVSSPKSYIENFYKNNDKTIVIFDTSCLSETPKHNKLGNKKIIIDAQIYMNAQLINWLKEWQFFIMSVNNDLHELLSFEFPQFIIITNQLYFELHQFINVSSNIDLPVINIDLFSDKIKTLLSIMHVSKTSIALEDTLILGWSKAEAKSIINNFVLLQIFTKSGDEYKLNRRFKTDEKFLNTNFNLIIEFVSKQRNFNAKIGITLLKLSEEAGNIESNKPLAIKVLNSLLKSNQDSDTIDEFISIVRPLFSYQNKIFWNSVIKAYKNSGAFKKALEIAVILKDTEQITAIYIETGEIEKAKTEISNNSSFAAQTIRAELLFRQGELEAAKATCNDLLANSKKEKGKYISNIYNTLGLAFLMENKLYKSVEFFNKAYNSYDESENKARALHNLGLVELQRQNIRQALYFFQKSFLICANSLNILGQSKNLYHLAGSYYSMGNHNLAFKYLKESIVASRKLDDTNGQFFSLMNLADMFINWGNFKGADRIINIVKNLAIKTNDQHKLHLIKLKEALKFLFLGEYSHTQQLIPSLINWFKNKNMPYYIVQIHLIEAEIAMATNNRVSFATSLISLKTAVNKVNTPFFNSYFQILEGIFKNNINMVEQGFNNIRKSGFHSFKIIAGLHLINMLNAKNQAKQYNAVLQKLNEIVNRYQKQIPEQYRFYVDKLEFVKKLQNKNKKKLKNNINKIKEPVLTSKESEKKISSFQNMELPINLNRLKQNIEKEYIAKALAKTHGNISRAATLLGLKRSRLSQKIKEYNMKKNQELL